MAVNVLGKFKSWLRFDLTINFELQFDIPLLFLDEDFVKFHFSDV